jgi:ribosomal protein S18 acetylase RimI-like enzyme
MSLNNQILIKELSANDALLANAFFENVIDNTFNKTFPSPALKKAKSDFSASKIKEVAGSVDRVILGAFEGETIVGIMFGSMLNGGVASVVWIAVGMQFRGKGIGRKLMNITFEKYKSKGAHKVVLYTETVEAKEFYESIGMQQEGFHPNHWWKIDHYCFGKIL